MEAAGGLNQGRRRKLGGLRAPGLLIIAVSLILASCQKDRQEAPARDRLRVIATIFPLYDFARGVGGDRAEVTMLLPPGVEPHGFEPRPREIRRIQDADVFLFTHREMEPWALNLAQGAGGAKLLIIDASRGIELLPAGGTVHVHREGEKESKDHEHRVDPHIWLDFARAGRMVETILAGFIAKDPANAAYYQANAREYNKRLAQLDARFAEGLRLCKSPIIVSGGHTSFGYLARRYNLKYRAAYPLSPQAEPRPRELAGLVKLIKGLNIRHIFHEELLDPRIAQTLAAETGAALLRLHGAHNVTKEDISRGVSFLSLMEENLRNLQIGLLCPTR